MYITVKIMLFFMSSSNWLSATIDFKEYVMYFHVLNWNYKLIFVEIVC